MRTIRIYGLQLMVLAAAVVLVGCWKEDLSDCPGGRINLETYWEDKIDGVEIPDRYWVVIGGYSELLTGNYNEIDHTFSPGDYRMYVYNTADKITVNGTTAMVAVDGAGIANMPGYMFTYSEDVPGLTEDEYRTVYAYMAQQVGEITYEIIGGGNVGRDAGAIISTINSVRLEGVASRMDIGTGALSGPSGISPGFTLERGTYTAQSRILGTVGTTQTLTLNVNLPSGATQLMSGDAAPVLAGFNTWKTGYYRLIIRITAVDNNGDITAWTLNGEPGSVT